MGAAKKSRPMGDVGPVFRGDIVEAANAEELAPRRGQQKKGLEKVMYRLTSTQIAALRSEAFKRAQERGSGRPDASEVLRELVDAWIARRR